MIFLNNARVKVVLASVKGVEDAIVSDTKKETSENNETVYVVSTTSGIHIQVNRAKFSLIPPFT